MSRPKGILSEKRNKTYEEMYGSKKAKEIKISLHNKNIGKKLSKKTKENMKKNRVGMLGKNHSKKTKEKISNSKKQSYKDGKTKLSSSCWKMGDNLKENNPNWNNGSSFEPYSIDWTDTLRKAIRERDKYTCQVCKKEGFIIHHIDYNKKNCNLNNLINLCNSCHSKTNRNRKFWTKFFREKKHVMD